MFGTFISCFVKSSDIKEKVCYLQDTPSVPWVLRRRGGCSSRSFYTPGILLEQHTPSVPLALHRSGKTLLNPQPSAASLELVSSSTPLGSCLLPMGCTSLSTPLGSCLLPTGCTSSSTLLGSYKAAARRKNHLAFGWCLVSLGPPLRLFRYLALWAKQKSIANRCTSTKFVDCFYF